MKRIQLIIILCIICVFATHAQDKYKNRVVKIEVYNGANEKIETGSGIIVGQGGDEVFVVTALHVVQSDDLFSGSEGNRIEVTFFQASWQTFSAKIFEKVNDELDLAILVVAVSQTQAISFENYKVSEKDHLAVDDPVVSLGNPLGSDWFINTTNKIQDLNYNLGNFTISPNSISPGYSGGAVFRGKNGHWVGMFTTLTQNEAILVSGEYIIDLLQQWNVPHQFIKFATPLIIPKSAYLWAIAGGGIIGYSYVPRSQSENDYQIYLDNPRVDAAVWENRGQSREEFKDNLDSKLTISNFITYTGIAVASGAIISTIVKNRNRNRKKTPRLSLVPNMQFQNIGNLQVGKTYSLNFSIKF